MEVRMVNTPSADSNNEPVACYVAIELSKSGWLVGFLTPLSDKTSRYQVKAGDAQALLDLIERVRARVARQLNRPVEVMSCYEAGYDGFWLHRVLEAHGIHNHVLDPASLQVNRRARRARQRAPHISPRMTESESYYRARGFSPRARQGEKAMQLGKEQRADMQLRAKIPRTNEPRQLCRGDELHRDTRLRFESRHAAAGPHEEGMNPVAQSARAGERLAQGVNAAHRQPGFFGELAASAVEGLFAGIDQSGGQLPRVGFERRAELPHNRDLPSRG